MLNILSIEYSLWNFVPYFFKNCWYFLITVEQIIRKDSDPKQGRLVVYVFTGFFASRFNIFYIYCIYAKTLVLLLLFSLGFDTCTYDVFSCGTSKRNIPAVSNDTAPYVSVCILYSMYVHSMYCTWKRGGQPSRWF